jgi:hypothetical protein
MRHTSVLDRLSKPRRIMDSATLLETAGVEINRLVMPFVSRVSGTNVQLLAAFSS